MGTHQASFYLMLFIFKNMNLDKMNTAALEKKGLMYSIQILK